LISPITGPRPRAATTNPVKPTKPGNGRVFRNCAAVNRTYLHGIAKNFKVIKKATGLTGRPFVSLTLYAANRGRLDRDGDGVACET
jgi:Excalibur calcium-binding domain